MNFLRSVLLLGLLVVSPLYSEDSEALSIRMAVESSPQSGAQIIEIDPAKNFHVVITNHSSTRQRIWMDNNSWGYHSLWFEIIVPNGQKFEIKKKGRHLVPKFAEFL